MAREITDPTGGGFRPVTAFAALLAAAIDSVTVEDFRVLERRYDDDSRRGRELLHLIANSNWVRGTTEIVTASRSDAVDTSVQVEIDLDQVRHEALADAARISLPLLVLPPGRKRAPAPPPRARAWRSVHRLVRRPVVACPPDVESPLTLSVTDGGGALVPALPISDVHHRIAAGLAEIILTMAVARWVDRPEQLMASRETRLLLAAAIFRLLRDPAWRPDTLADTDSSGSSAGGGAVVAGRTEAASGAGGPAGHSVSPLAAVDSAPGAGHSSGPENDTPNQSTPGRLTVARSSLHQVLQHYTGIAGSDRSVRRGQRPDKVARALAGRAVSVIQAFMGASVVVVSVDRERSPAVFTVRTPTRRMRQVRAPLLRRPRAGLMIDRLVASPDAVRQLQVVLPDGLTTETPEHGRRSPIGRLCSGPPRAFEQLSHVLEPLLPNDTAPTGQPPEPAVCQSLAELAAAKVDTARQVLQHYAATPDSEIATTRAIDERLRRLRNALVELAAGGGRHQLAAVAELWNGGGWLPGALWSRSVVDAVRPRTVTLRTEAVEDPIQRGTPVEERLELDVTVTDSNLFDVARYVSSMSLVLLAAIFGFLVLSSARLNAEVLAGVLTLFSAVQAGRIEHPDRSMLRGLVGASGYWVIVASVMPTVVFAVALGFLGQDDERGRATIAAAVTFWVQAFVQLVMTRGPLADVGTPGTRPGLLLATEPHPDHARAEVLHAQWWRSTTAEALLLGREAHAYVAYQEQGGLRPLLTAEPTMIGRVFQRVTAAANGASPTPGPQSVLGLLRAGTTGDALNFIVLRQEPVAHWQRTYQARPIELDTERLAPVEAPAHTIDVFAGVPVLPLPSIARHPVTTVARIAADHDLLLLDTQLPVPAPVNLNPDLWWARVRVGVRDGSMARVGPFLQELARAGAGPGRKEIWVQTTPEGRLRPLAGEPVPWTDPGPLPSAQLDVLSWTADSLDVREWRVLALCADARPGIEADVLTSLGRVLPALSLAGLTTAQIHGLSVIFVLGRRLEPSAGMVELTGLAELSTSELRASDHFLVVVDERRTAAQLAEGRRIPPSTLLRVQLQSQDQPGLLVNALDSLSTHLPVERAPGHGTPEVQPWYVFLQVADGQLARAAMTLRVPDSPGSPDLTEAVLSTAARRVRRDLEAEQAHGVACGYHAAATVVEIKMVRADRRGSPSLLLELETLQAEPVD